MLILSKSDISKLVSMKEVIKEIEESLKEVILGNVWMPPRISTKIENNKGWIGIMPCYIKNKNAPNIKVKNIASCNTVILFLLSLHQLTYHISNHNLLY